MLRNKFLLLYVFIYFLQSSPQVFSQTESPKKQANQLVSFKIINTINNTYGYDIYLNNKLVIHQPSKPGIAGNKGFSKKREAELMAKFVVKKVLNNEMPPTVLESDYRKLKIDIN